VSSNPHRYVCHLIVLQQQSGEVDVSSDPERTVMGNIGSASFHSRRIDRRVMDDDTTSSRHQYTGPPVILTMCADVEKIHSRVTNDEQSPGPDRLDCGHTEVHDLTKTPPDESMPFGSHANEPPASPRCYVDHANNSNHTFCGGIKCLLKRCRGTLNILTVLVFGIVLYVTDVVTDIMAGVEHFQEGHPIWGSLTITFVVFPAICWAAVNWTWWYTWDFEKQIRGNSTVNRRKRKGTHRMWLSVLLLDPLTRYLLSAFVHLIIN